MGSTITGSWFWWLSLLSIRKEPQRPKKMKFPWSMNLQSKQTIFCHIMWDMIKSLKWFRKWVSIKSFFLWKLYEIYHLPVWSLFSLKSSDAIASLRGCHSCCSCAPFLKSWMAIKFAHEHVLCSSTTLLNVPTEVVWVFGTLNSFSGCILGIWDRQDICSHVKNGDLKRTHSFEWCLHTISLS